MKSFLSSPSIFQDYFLESFENETKKESTPKLQLSVPQVDASLSFLSPSVLNTFNDVGLEQMFQPLIDESSIPSGQEYLISSPTAFVEPDHFFNPEALQNEYLALAQEQQEQHVFEEEQAYEDEQPTVSKQEISADRVWSTSYKNEPIVGNGDVEISLKTRREKPTSLVPERLYSSLKYEVLITAEGEFVRSVPFLLARISVIDAKTFEPILKNNKEVTKGENESALTKIPNGPGNLAKGTIKVQFDSSVSFHHYKKEVRLEINFFKNEALDQPILTKRTVPVKMFARKPNKKQDKNAPTSSTAPKRKREESTEENPAKITKIEQPEFQLSDFEKRLDSLVESSRNLSYEDRQRATALILHKFGLPFNVLADPYNTPYYPQYQ